MGKRAADCLPFRETGTPSTLLTGTLRGQYIQSLRLLLKTKPCHITPNVFACTTTPLHGRLRIALVTTALFLTSNRPERSGLASETVLVLVLSAYPPSL